MIHFHTNVIYFQKISRRGDGSHTELVLTVGELLAGKRLDAPPTRDVRTGGTAIANQSGGRASASAT